SVPAANCSWSRVMDRHTDDSGRTLEHLTSDAVVASLMSLPKYGEGIGVHRILYLLQEIASTEWYRALDAIKVTGSKGKGSVTTLTAAILRPFGRVGVFTSPHLVDFAE